MKVTPIRTNPIEANGPTLEEVLDRYLGDMKEGSILAITSKIVAICEGRVVRDDQVTKQELIEQEAEYFLPADLNKYGITLTITDHTLMATAGIDSSNGNGYYILWPKDSAASASKIRDYLKKRFSLTNVGVIITDSKTTPMRWGTTGIGLGHAGFMALTDYINQPDIYGRPMEVTQANMLDGLSAAAVLAMGEGNEQTPLAMIEDVPFISFLEKDPRSYTSIRMEEDLYGPLLTSVEWKKGKPSQ